MEKKMETTIIYRDYIGDILGYGVMEKKMEITTLYRDYIGVILGYGGNGKENRNYYII